MYSTLYSLYYIIFNILRKKKNYCMKIFLTYNKYQLYTNKLAILSLYKNYQKKMHTLKCYIIHYIIIHYLR